MSKVLFEDYYDILSQNQKDINSFSIPVGITEENILETLDVPPLPHRHILVTGYPGSGKSNFLHLVLNAVFLNLSADQAQIWLHDSKGFEYKKLQELQPTHVVCHSTGDSAVACEAFVQSLDEEYKKRIQYFQEKQVQSFVSCLRKQRTSCPPRIFVLIDDFDAFLWSCQDNREMLYRIDNLLRMGFALGVTFIVTAQTCNSPWSMNRFAEIQFGVRIYLAQNEMFIREQIKSPDAIELAKTLIRGEALLAEPDVHKVKLLYISSEIEAQVVSACCRQKLCAAKPQYTLDYIMAREGFSKERVPGAFHARHDQFTKKWHLQIQLDNEHLWYLSVFVRDDGSFEKYSLDEASANDSHYEFVEEQKIRKSMYSVGDENKYFHEILIPYVQAFGGEALLNQIMPYVTEQFHFY